MLTAELIGLFITHNVRSLHANEDSFMAMLDTLNRRPDVIVLTETWLNCHTVDLCNIRGYVFVYHTVHDDRRGGGVSVYCSLALTSKKIQSLCERRETIGS